jgi:signal transduction histidine kinase/DNA-binding response OmpR family regulator
MATILVIDDDPINRDYLRTLLGYDGHRVVEAGDGAEGLAMMRAEIPDLVIADVLMPTMDGFEFARQARLDAALAQANIIFWTAAYREQEVRKLAQRCGVSTILRKPSEPQEVLKVVNETLGLSAPRPLPASVDEFDREHLRLLTDKLSQKVSELEAVSLRLEALIEASREVAAEHDPERLLERVCRAGREILGAGYASVGILDDQGDGLRHFKIRGVPTEAAASMTQPAIRSGVIGALLAERRPLRQRNPSGNPQALGFPTDHPAVYSFLGAPIASSIRLYGWLGLRNKVGADEFSAEDERLTEALAAQVAVAYENALRYKAIQHHATELEQRVQERTAELRRSNAELEQFAYVASHDLQEPLRKVVGYTQLLGKRYRGQLDADADEFITYAVDAASRMQLLIQDLLTYSRVDRLGRELAPVDAEAILSQVLRNLQAMVEETGAVATHDPLPTVMADAGQIGQLFQNLLVNALKFHGEQPPHVHVGVARQGRGWVFSVRDHGIGIDPQYADRIFRMFQRLHSRDAYPGTGIGLAICQKIVQRHGGTIWVESQPGQGATFSFTLPESTSAAPHPASITGERQP